MFIGVQEDMFSMLGERTESRKDKLFRENIQRGSGFSGGKERIREAVTKYAIQFEKLTEFIRKEYGTGGFTGSDNSFVEFDGSKMTIIDYTQRYDSPETGEWNKHVEWRYTWPEVVKKIIELIIREEY